MSASGRPAASKLASILCGVALALTFAMPAAADDYDQYRTACDAAQTAIVKAAIAEAKSLARQASAALPPVNSDTGGKFQRWFGGEEGDSDATLKAIYDEMATLLDVNVFWCANRTNISKPSTVAFVLRDSSREIFIMGQFFFKSPLSGFDSQAGTLVHEAAHQSTLANVADRDVTGDGKADYGIENAEQLARTRSADARRTGDNIEYFAEDIAYSP